MFAALGLSWELQHSPAHPPDGHQAVGERVPRVDQVVGPGQLGGGGGKTQFSDRAAGVTAEGQLCRCARLACAATKQAVDHDRSSSSSREPYLHRSATSAAIGCQQAAGRQRHSAAVIQRGRVSLRCCRLVLHTAQQLAGQRAAERIYANRSLCGGKQQRWRCSKSGPRSDGTQSFKAFLPQRTTVRAGCCFTPAGGSRSQAGGAGWRLPAQPAAVAPHGGPQRRARRGRACGSDHGMEEEQYGAASELPHVRGTSWTDMHALIHPPRPAAHLSRRSHASRATYSSSRRLSV